MNNRFLLDSWAILALLFEERPAAEQIQQLLDLAADGRARLFLSVINLGEVFYIVARRHGGPVAEEIVDRMRHLPIHVLAATEPRVMMAARFKAKRAISYADAFAVSAAVELDAALVSGDPEILALKDLQLEPLTRNPQ